MDFTTRPPTMADLPAVVDLINDHAIDAIGAADISTERLATFWGEETRDLAHDNLLVIDAAGTLQGYADISEYPPYDIVEADWTTRPGAPATVRDLLLDWAEARARGLLPKAPPDRPAILESGIWASRRGDAEALRARGFELARIWHRMLITMDAAPEPACWPADISVRTFDPAEIDRVHTAWEDAQRDEWGFASLTDSEFRYYFVGAEPNFDPTLWFLAIDDASGEIAGYLLGRWERPGQPEIGQVRYLGVRRPYRRRGIAGALLRHAFAEFYRRGRTAAGLAVDSSSLTGAERLYERAGMRIEAERHVFHKVLRPPE